MLGPYKLREFTGRNNKTGRGREMGLKYRSVDSYGPIACRERLNRFSFPPVHCMNTARQTMHDKAEMPQCMPGLQGNGIVYLKI